MPKRILIDASHSEETRVVVLQNGRVEEFESQTAIKRQLKGNIYLAKVTRVEPSLQAAFVDYGGDRHGFLPFSEIHPDYYQLPVADKQELLASIKSYQQAAASDDTDESDADATDESENTDKPQLADAEQDETIIHDEATEEIGEEEKLDNIGELNLYKRYKIQEVIKRNQIILVQVEKEERGNKGASLTTFISLAGRFCVLMPNAIRKGGVSRRIGSFEDRRRLKQIVKGLNVPDETGLIVRTAGAGKSKEQIQNDYDYLVKSWNDIRNQTLESTAPAFIHAEGDIVTRTLRDWHGNDIDEMLIEGDHAFKIAKGYVNEVMPEHKQTIKQYKNKVPIFSRYRVEEQMAKLYGPEATLESGGSLVISPTEALISIDVNSGRLTNTRNVEDTALNTNLEAAREIARQLRLRNLSGLIVIDFIDMLELKNKKAIERELKNAFAGDRAKIQIGRISTFGLLEMSRQRLSPSFLEVNTIACPYCDGVGFIKSAGSTAANVLRAIEQEISRGTRCREVEVLVPVEVAIYMLNNKRPQLTHLEKTYSTHITIYPEDKVGLDGFTIDKIGIIKGDKRKTNQKEETESPEEETSSKSDRKGSKSNVAPESGDTAYPDVQEKRGLFEGLWEKIID